MKRPSHWLVVAGCAAMSGAIDASEQPPSPPSGATPAAPATRLSKADLEEMLAPIALYPDSLLANTLAASVYEEDFKAAAKFIAGGGTAAQAADKPWDPSVKAIVAFPAVIKLLGDNTPWAVAVGQAYLTQGSDVMAAVQSLRARAWANGSLKTTPQQTVVTEGQTIVIQPANPQIIYVPTYNPSVVYVEKSSSSDVAAAGVIGFGVGIAAGLIIANNMDCNWYGGCIGYGHSHSNNNVNINVNNNNNTINNISSGNNINAGNRPGQDGAQWKPNQAKLSPTATSGPALSQYKGVGTSGSAAATAAVPGRTAGSKPIASSPTPPAAKPRPADTARPSAPTARPSASEARPAAPAARPSPPAAPAARSSAPTAKPASAPRPSGFNPSGGGGSRSRGGGSRGGGGRGR